MLDYFDRGKNWPSNWWDSVIVNQLAMPDPIRLTYLLVDSMVSVDRRLWLLGQRLRVRHDCGYVLLRRCAQNGIGDRMDRSRRCEMFDIVRFCIWDDVVGCAVRWCREQIDIFHHIYTHQLLQMDDTVRFYICKRIKCIRLRLGWQISFSCEMNRNINVP